MATKNKLSIVAFKIAAIYAIFGYLWILLSDKLLLFLVQNTKTANSLQTYKGWFYVLVTSALVYALINRHFKSQRTIQNRYRRLLDNISDSIYLADSDGNIIDANKAACEKLGYNYNETLSLKLTDIDPNTNIHEWSNFIKSADADLLFSLESQHRCKDGTIFPAEISACVFDEGESRFCLGVARDVSMRKKAQELLVQSEKMSSLGELSAGIAHEINNPLSSIMGASQNIYNRIFNDSTTNMRVAEECSISLKSLRSYLKQREVDRMLESISVSGIRASKIVHSMLNFSRKEPKQLCICSLNMLLNETIDLISTDYNLNKKYDFRHIKITREFEEDSPSVCCVGNEIQQVFINIFRNATEAMMEKQYPDGTNPELILRLQSTDTSVIIEIEDNGPGMTEEVRNRIFEPFYTSKDVGKGTGLGLSISYFIITDLHHGEMTVSSIKDMGSLFTITLPRKMEQTALDNS